MQKLRTASVYVLVPFSGPAGVDVTTLTASMAIVGESSGEPADSDYHAATWINGEIGYNPGAVLAEGIYYVYVKVAAGSEDVRLLSGRLRVGDPRT